MMKKISKVECVRPGGSDYCTCGGLMVASVPSYHEHAAKTSFPCFICKLRQKPRIV